MADSSKKPPWLEQSEAESRRKILGLMGIPGATVTPSGNLVFLNPRTGKHLKLPLSSVWEDRKKSKALIGSALRAGFVPLDEESFMRRQAAYDSELRSLPEEVGAYIRAGAEGFKRGITDIAEAGFGLGASLTGVSEEYVPRLKTEEERETQRKLGYQYPLTTALGMAYSPMGKASLVSGKVLGSAVKRSGEALARRGLPAAGLGGKVVPKVAEFGLEGALFGSALEASNQNLAKSAGLTPQELAEALIAGSVDGGIAGLVTGGVFGLGGKALGRWKKSSSALREGLEAGGGIEASGHELIDKVAGVAGRERAEKEALRLIKEAEVTGATPDEILRRFTEGNYGEKLVKMESQKIAEEAARILREPEAKLYSALESSTRLPGFYAKLKDLIVAESGVTSKSVWESFELPMRTLRDSLKKSIREGDYARKGGAAPAAKDIIKSIDRIWPQAKMVSKPPAPSPGALTQDVAGIDWIGSPAEKVLSAPSMPAKFKDKVKLLQAIDGIRVGLGSEAGEAGIKRFSRNIKIKNEITDGYNILRSMFMDREVVGDALASAKEQLNGPLNDLLTNQNYLFQNGILKKARERRGPPGSREGFQSQVKFSEGKLTAAIKAGEGRDYDAIVGYLNAVINTSKAIDSVFPAGKKSSDLIPVRTKKAIDMLESGRQLNKEAAAVAEIIEKVGAGKSPLSKMAPGVGGAVAGGAVGLIAGGPVVGALLGMMGRGAGKLADSNPLSAYSAIDRSAKTAKEMLDGMLKLFAKKATSKSPGKISKSITEAKNKMKEKGFNVSPSSTALVLSVGNAISKKEKKEKPKNEQEAVVQISNYVRGMRDNPDSMAEATSLDVLGISESSPELASDISDALARGIVFLAGKVDELTFGSGDVDLLQPGIQAQDVPSGNISKLSRYIAGVYSPAVLAVDLMEGTLAKETVEAVQFAYPALHQYIVNTSLKYLNEETEPAKYEDRLIMSTLMGANMVAALRPENLAINQAQFGSQPPPATPGAPAPKTGGTTSAAKAKQIKAPGMTATVGQRMEMKGAMA